MGLHQSVSAQILDKKQADIISSKFVFIEINIVLLLSQDQATTDGVPLLYIEIWVRWPPTTKAQPSCLSKHCKIGV